MLSEIPERFKILYIDLIIGPDISSLRLISKSMFKLLVEYHLYILPMESYSLAYMAPNAQKEELFLHWKRHFKVISAE